MKKYVSVASYRKNLPRVGDDDRTNDSDNEPSINSDWLISIVTLSTGRRVSRILAKTRIIFSNFASLVEITRNLHFTSLVSSSACSDYRFDLTEILALH